MDVRHNGGAKELYMEPVDAEAIIGADAAKRIFNVGGNYSRTAIATFMGRKHLFLLDIHKSNTVWSIPIPTSKLGLRQTLTGDGIELLRLLLTEGEILDARATILAEELLRLTHESKEPDKND